MMKRICIMMLCLMLIFTSAGCSKSGKAASHTPTAEENQRVDKTALKMDTTVSMKVYGPNAEQAIEAAMTRIDEIEQMASNTIETSDISKINQAAGKEYVKVHPEVIKMLKTAIKYSEISNGAFDITGGAIIKLWGIGTDNARLPSEAEIKANLPLVGYKALSINEAEGSVKLLKEGMSIDLGGIAKGFTADEVVKILKDNGVKSALISLGGSSIYTLGTKPDGTPWRVAVQHPREERNQGSLGVIVSSDQAISTSGDYERYFIKDGKRYHHILNFSTGYPTDNGVISDTIVIDNDIPDRNMIADILTKMVFVSGVDKGLEIINSIPGVSCMVITSDFKVYRSTGWKVEMTDWNSEFTIVK